MEHCGGKERLTIMEFEGHGVEFVSYILVSCALCELRLVLLCKWPWCPLPKLFGTNYGLPLSHCLEITALNNPAVSQSLLYILTYATKIQLELKQSAQRQSFPRYMAKHADALERIRTMKALFFLFNLVIMWWTGIFWRSAPLYWVSVKG